MKYRITLPATPVDIEAIRRVLQAVDPAGVADLDVLAGTVRMSTWATEAEVRAVMTGAGLRVSADQVERLASECCGGCGG